MIGISIVNSLGVNITGLNPATRSFVSTAGITNPVQVSAINNLINGLQADGIWPKMKAIYPFVTDNRNLLGYTEDFSNVSGWGGLNMPRTSNTTLAPNNTLTADTITTSANSNNAIYPQTPFISSGQTFTHSLYVKYNNAQWLTLEIWTGSAQNGIRLWVDVQNGVLGTGDATLGTYVSKSISNVGNGWYRVSLTGIMPTGQSVYLGCRHVDGDGAYNFTAVNGKATYIWGAQSEVGTLTDYQPIATSQQAYIASQFKYNLKDPRDSDAAYRLVFNGGWTHSSNGATPNGTNGWADTKFNPSVSGQLNSAHISYYSRTNNIVDQQIEIGANAPAHFLCYRFTSGVAYHGINSSDTPTSVPFAPSTGLLLGSRINSATGKFYTNGSLALTDNKVSTSRPNFNISIGALNNNGTNTFFTNKQTAFASIGDGLTDTEAQNLYTRVQAFQTALSRNV
jgi:hypothetical protein